MVKLLCPLHPPVYTVVVTVRDSERRQKWRTERNKRGSLLEKVTFVVLGITHTLACTHISRPSIKALHQGPSFFIKVLEEQTARGARNVMREQYEQLRSPRVWTFQQGADTRRRHSPQAFPEKACYARLIKIVPAFEVLGLGVAKISNIVSEKIVAGDHGLK